jgi:hypothetical protein
MSEARVRELELKLGVVAVVAYEVREVRSLDV